MNGRCPVGDRLHVDFGKHGPILRFGLRRERSEYPQCPAVALQQLTGRAASDALEVPAREGAGRASQVEPLGIARRASTDGVNLAGGRPVSVAGRYRFDFAGPVRHHDVQLLPVVGALISASRTGLAEALGFGDQRFDPVAFPVKTATAADESEREGHIAHSVGDLEGEVAEGHIDGVVP